MSVADRLRDISYAIPGAALLCALGAGCAAQSQPSQPSQLEVLRLRGPAGEIRLVTDSHIGYVKGVVYDHKMRRLSVNCKVRDSEPTGFTLHLGHPVLVVGYDEMQPLPPGSHVSEYSLESSCNMQGMGPEVTENAIIQATQGVDGDYIFVSKATPSGANDTYHP